MSVASETAMAHIERILVPVDLSPCSRMALDYAVFLADEFGASVDVLHVWQPAESRRVVDVPEPAPSLAADDLREFVAGAQQPKRATLRQRIELGHPWKRIVEEASSGQFDLLVIGTHGLTGRLHMIMGSMTEQVVRTAPCPVLTVRGPE